MNYKSPELKDQWHELDPLIRRILCEIEVAAYPMPMFITSLIRTEAEQIALFEAGQAPAKTSVHCYGRGADFRPFPNEEFNKWLLEDINTRYVYDPTRPDKRTLIRHEGTALHFHLQSLFIGDVVKHFTGGKVWQV